MRKFLGCSVLALFLAVLAAYIVGRNMPRHWQAERAIVIQAEAPAVHAWVDDLQRWPEWMPWRKELDSTVVVSFAGAPRGPGAELRWRGEQVGEAVLTITKSAAGEGVWYDLAVKGAEIPSHGSITYASQGLATQVTWRDGGPMPDSAFARLQRPMVESLLEQLFAESLVRLKKKVEGG